MTRDEKLDSLQYAADNSIALSLGLTSYVHSGLAPAEIICRPHEPRDALDQLISAWMRNDRQLLEKSLAQHAKTALTSMLTSRTWSAMRSELWYAKAGANVAVGYRFDIAGPLSEAPETLSDTNGDG